MDHRFRRSTFAGGEEDPQSSSENGPDSPLSGDDRGATATAPSPKKSRRSILKRVVSVPIADVEGSSLSRSGRGEAFPPSDSWAWRKYGQKPIKGSPYPRGYYRCSSSKGCPARKQVERSRVDPTMLVITYASDHNHPHPTSSKHHNHHSAAITAPTTAAPNPSSSPAATPSSPYTTTTAANNNAKDGLMISSTSEDNHHDDHVDDKGLFPGPSDLELGGDHPLMDFSWLTDVAFEAPSFVGPRCIDDDADVGISSTTVHDHYPNVKMREEDEKMFADLDELPECSAVFRRGRAIDGCNLGPAAAAPVCGGTG